MSHEFRIWTQNKISFYTWAFLLLPHAGHRDDRESHTRDSGGGAASGSRGELLGLASSGPTRARSQPDQQPSMASWPCAPAVGHGSLPMAAIGARLWQPRMAPTARQVRVGVLGLQQGRRRHGTTKTDDGSELRQLATAAMASGTGGSVRERVERVMESAW
jgi:hypothetical protein